MDRALYPRAQIIAAWIKLMPNQGCRTKYSGESVFFIIR